MSLDKRRLYRLLYIVSLVAIGDSFPESGFINYASPEGETHLTSEDFKNAKQLGHSLSPRIAGNDPLEKGAHFEGDINLNGLTIEQVLGRNGLSLQQNPLIQYSAIRGRYHYWNSKEVPYTLSSRYTSKGRALIADAMQQYHDQTCIRFVERKNQDDYLYIVPDEGCYSNVGRQGGRQIVSLSRECMHRGVVMHELMHSIGFFHEQSRTDRDNYVDIVWDNVAPSAKSQFQKYDLSVMDLMGTAYDYSSILHYSSKAFTRNGKDTIIPKKKGAKIGQRNGFSEEDRKKINLLYQCDPSKITISKNTFKVSTSSSRGRGSSGTGSITGPGSENKKPVSNSLSIRFHKLIGTGGDGNSNTGDKCSDSLYNCANLARRGVCITKADQMASDCPESCGKCDRRSSRRNGSRETATSRRTVPETSRRSSTNQRRTSSCGDSNTNCREWARHGFCTVDYLKDKVQARCKAACNLC